MLLMLGLKLIRELDVHSASGLVKIAGNLCVVSDDENHLVILLENGETTQVPLLPGELPLELKERKKLKPDFEAICGIDDEVIAIPSASTDLRMKGVAYHVRTRTLTNFTITALAAELIRSFPELNIEGATFVHNELWLFQRGNGALGANAVIVLDRKSFLSEMQQGSITSVSLKEIRPVNLGDHEGATFGFTDACFANNSIYFLAVAEDSKSTYEDGMFLGSLLGRMDLKGNILNQTPLSCDQKPEGLWVEGQRIYLVTDADDRKVLSRLYTANLEALS